MGHRVFSRSSAIIRRSPISVANRLLASGYIVRRNTLWKDNSFFAFDFRANKNFRLTERFTLQAIVDAFNLTNSNNPKHPETPACCSISMERCRADWEIRDRPNSACASSSRLFAREGSDHSKFRLMMQSSPDFTFTLTCRFFSLAS